MKKGGGKGREEEKKKSRMQAERERESVYVVRDEEKMVVACARMKEVDWHVERDARRGTWGNMQR